MATLDIRARTADDQIRARQIIEHCLPLDCFFEIYCNAYNVGREYIIARKRDGGYETFGVDMDNGILIN